jgi:hypothetical protein
VLDCCCAAPQFLFFRVFSSFGVLFMDGPEWERLTRVMAPVFHGSNVNFYLGAVATATRTHMEALVGAAVDLFSAGRQSIKPSPTPHKPVHFAARIIFSDKECCACA